MAGKILGRTSSRIIPTTIFLIQVPSPVNNLPYRWLYETRKQFMVEQEDVDSQ